MATERQQRETVERCAASMVYYHNVGRSRRAVEMMAAEAQLVAAFVADELRLDDREIEASIIGPLGIELIARFGHEVGPRLLGEFVDAFEFRETIDGRVRGNPAPAAAPGSTKGGGRR